MTVGRVKEAPLRKCRYNKKNDCNDCEYEGCPNYGASLEEGDLDEW